MHIAIMYHTGKSCHPSKTITASQQWKQLILIQKDLQMFQTLLTLNHK